MVPIVEHTIVDVPVPWILTRSGKVLQTVLQKRCSVVAMPQNLENSSRRFRLGLRNAANSESLEKSSS